MAADSNYLSGLSTASKPSFKGSSEMEKSTDNKKSRQKTSVVSISVADVYDIACDIGKEFELLIDSHGPEHVTGLMQKVIGALEELERLADDKDHEMLQIEDLRTLVRHLELEDTKNAAERHRTSQELEQIEEHYKQETRDLLSTVKRLQNENRKLASSLAAANERDSAFSEDDSYFEVDLVKKMETVIEKQRNEIKKLDQIVLDQKTESDELKCQNEKLSACTRDIRRNLRSTQSQLYDLVDERTSLTTKVHDLRKELRDVEKKLGMVNKECEDLSGVVADHENLKGKVVYDENGPDRPKFSLTELRDILQERNELKAHLSDLEDELSMYRPDNFSGVVSPKFPRVRLAAIVANCSCSYHSKKRKGLADAEDSDIEENNPCDEWSNSPSNVNVDVEDLPVQGPLPKDPDDAPFKKKKESGIRKLFRLFFGSS